MTAVGDQEPVLPPATIGMLGGGQLGRYALMAAKTMGYRTIVLDPDPAAPAGGVADRHLVAAYDDPVALQVLVESCAVVTTEFENPPADALDSLAAHVRVAPSPGAVRIAQDRIAEKRFLVEHGVAVGAHAVLDTGLDQVPTDLVTGGVIIKTARLGYDGKGQRRVIGMDELADAWNQLGDVPCIVEALLDLQTEISVLVARTADGRTCTWPIAENDHTDGILDVSVVPAPVSASLAEEAEQIALGLADALDYVGVLAVEMFVVRNESGDTRLLVNEMAPRPHNSGHWTLDGCVTSQYEQQIRAICGVGLGSTETTVPGIAMVNLLGDLWQPTTPDWNVALADPCVKLHLYGKHEARPGRKMGHLTVLGDSVDEARARAVELRAAL